MMKYLDNPEYYKIDDIIFNNIFRWIYQDKIEIEKSSLSGLDGVFFKII